MNQTKKYTRNLISGNDYPYVTLYSSFEDEEYFENLQWNMENLFVNTYQRNAFSVDAYEVDGDLVIPTGGLQPFDHYHLENAENYETYVMPNDQLLVEYYQDHIVNIYEYMDQIDNINKKGFVSRRYSDSMIDPLECKVSWHYSQMYVGIRCYDANGDPVQASSGTVDINGVFAAGGVETTITSLDASQTAPIVQVQMPVERIIASPNGLSGVDNWQLIVWQL